MAGRKAKKRKVARRPKALAPVPPGFGTVTPYLVVSGAPEAIEFYKKAFNAAEQLRETTPDGKVLHARLKIGSSVVMLAEEFPGSNARYPATLGSSTVTLHIYTKNVDKLWQQAVAAGGKVLMPLDSQFWGERYGQISDPFGHNWSLSQRIKMSVKEMEERRKAAMAMFSQAEHPGEREQS